MTLLPRHKLSDDGFFVVDDFLDRDTIGALIGAVESLDPDEQSSRMRRGVAFARRNLIELDFVRNLARHASLRGIIDAIDGDLIPVRAILFDKTASANWTVPWHQDRSIALHERIDTPGFGPWSTKAGVVHAQPPIAILQRMLTLRLHLDPCSIENGPLRVIPQTHNRILTQQEIETAVLTSAQISCTTLAGGLLVMRPLILHASSPATDPSHRRVIHIEFAPPELPNGLQWASKPLNF